MRYYLNISDDILIKVMSVKGYTFHFQLIYGTVLKNQ